MSATVIVDALWGDSGKGKTCAHLARRDDAALAVRAGIGTNAGASVTLDDGVLLKARQLPTGWVNPGTRAAVGPGVLVDPGIFAEEVERFGLAGRAFVDGRCAVITPEHIAAEEADEHLRGTVGSTCTGNGVARAEFAMRRARQARDVPELAPYVVDVAREVNKLAAGDGGVLIEGSQGTMLSLHFSDDYPYTTSGNCTTAAAMEDVGLNWRLLTDVVMVVKAMPTRVGGGPLPHEMSAAEAEARGIAEYGVHTGRARRKASRLDFALLEYAAMLNGPTQIALTFCDHLDPAMRGRRDASAITGEVRALMAEVEEATGAPVTLLDTGPGLSDVIDLG
ncbi:adenylosuccinate synthetase [Phytomonospora endophytica]|uniref:Adenylosuccinate synthetase n=1 Tax=Phytomonospora endophytica TaxID=714109 RepID=A0A841FSW3_9ACTN|nr:adenylosuccinate synthetase [Phytomonospora endophytica]MBB6039375.1 adenylosuccinate synthase [Phytomonospora endophytica]GIG69683.1 adenylosuccinate synthetase [Phytomonospora endophytica]